MLSFASIELECVLSSPRKKPKSRINKDANLVFFFKFFLLMFDLPKIIKIAKINKPEKAHNFSISSPTHDQFVAVFK